MDRCRPYDKFDRKPCEDAVSKHNISYHSQFVQSSCKNRDCEIGKNGTTDTSKEWELQMLQYSRMILISGYAISLVATCLGSFIMVILRRLRCTRIYIHINLQISFMLRAGIWLLHDIYGGMHSNTVIWTIKSSIYR